MKKRFIKIAMIFIIMIVATVSINIIICIGQIQDFPENRCATFAFDRF